VHCNSTYRDDHRSLPAAPPAYAAWLPGSGGHAGIGSVGIGSAVVQAVAEVGASLGRAGLRRVRNGEIVRLWHGQQTHTTHTYAHLMTNAHHICNLLSLGTLCVQQRGQRAKRDRDRGVCNVTPAPALLLHPQRPSTGCEGVDNSR
jgi:hypothetical protein